ncbi:helix-turn-helix domain-containing protein [Streptomyces sp. NPDC002577]
MNSTPESSPEAVQLVRELRRLRESAGLSLAGLAARTAYSKSSWARYLGGDQPVPRGAVEALCRVAGERPGRLIALWELADAEWSGRARTTAPRDQGAAQPRTAAAQDSADPPARSRAWPRPGPKGVLLAVVAAATLAAAGAGVALVRGGKAPGEPAQDTAPATYMPGCTGRTCEGKSPVAMGCGGAAAMVKSLVVHTAGGGQRVEIRYGTVCRAVWARASHLRRGDRVELTVRGGPAKAIRARPEDEDEYVSTTMTPVGDPQGTRVCLLPARGARECVEV